MDVSASISIELDFWDDSVGAFEPAKVIRQLRQAFSGVEIDPSDYQRDRLLRELEFWTQGEKSAELRETLVQQSWGNYQTNGPTYKFVIPFLSGHRVSGWARRLSIGFEVPVGLPPEHRGQLLQFLGSLHMGQPVLNAADADVEPHRGDPKESDGA